MRSYSGLLVFESVFDSIPSQEVLLSQFATTLFSPSVKIVEADCGTLLGKKVLTDYPIEGRIELSTGVPYTQPRISSLITSGTYFTHIRTLDTCTSKGGVCRACYAASRVGRSIPSVGDYLAIFPEYILASETTVFRTGESSSLLSYDSTAYDRVDVFTSGNPVTSGFTLVPPSDPSNPATGLIVLTTPATSDVYYTLHYSSVIRSPYLYWLAGTYSGSLLGMSPLPSPSLHLPQSLVSNSISLGQIEDLATSISATNRAPQDLVEYNRQIPGKLERSLFLLALGVIYSKYS